MQAGNTVTLIIHAIKKEESFALENVGKLLDISRLWNWRRHDSRFTDLALTRMHKGSRRTSSVCVCFLEELLQEKRSYLETVE